MLTDIFAYRYAQPRIWETFYEEHRRLLVQGYQLLNDLCPYYVGGNEDKRGKEFWTQIHNLLARELGLNELSPSYTGYYNKQNQWQGFYNSTMQMCETWMLAPFDGKISADRYVKERLSLVEIGFREHEDFVAEMFDQRGQRSSIRSSIRFTSMSYSFGLKIGRLLVPFWLGLTRAGRGLALSAALIFFLSCSGSLECGQISVSAVSSFSTVLG